MIYVMSDLHGRYDLYVKMLEKLNLQASDTLYILGDFVDRGPNGFKIILDIVEYDNIIPIMGNHDFLASTLLSRLNNGLKPGEMADLKAAIDMWLYDGGDKTLAEFRTLPYDKRVYALEIMDNFRNYAEVSVGDKTFVLCHGGIDGYVEGLPLDIYNIANFAFGREDYSKPKFKNPSKFLVTGHTPTGCIEGATEGKIHRANNHICVDCGAVYDLGLGAICLDTLEEFYVK